MNLLQTLLIPLTLFIANPYPILPEFQLNYPQQYFSQSSPYIISLPSNRFMVIWQSEYEEDGTTSQLEGAFIESDLSITNRYSLGLGIAEYCSYPKLALLHNGEILIGAHCFGFDPDFTTNSPLEARYLPEMNILSWYRHVAEDQAANQNFKDLTVLSNGKYMLTWYDSPTHNVWMKIFEEDGTLEAEDRIGADNGPDKNKVRVVGMKESTDVWAVWHIDVDTSNYGVLRIKKIEQDGNMIFISNNQINDGLRVKEGAAFSLCLAENDNLVVLWVSDEGLAGDALWMRAYNTAGEPRFDPLLISTDVATLHRASDCVQLADGSIVVIWSTASGSIKAKKFDSDLAASGPEFTVNVHQTGVKQKAMGAARESGGLIVVWESQGQDIYGFGIYGKLVCFETSHCETEENSLFCDPTLHQCSENCFSDQDCEHQYNDQVYCNTISADQNVCSVCQNSQVEYYHESNQTCTTECNQPFTVKNQKNTQVCAFPCEDNEYYYQNGECHNECVEPFSSKRTDGYKYCFFPCEEGEFYSIDLKKCVKSCEEDQGFTQIPHFGFKLCEFKCQSQNQNIQYFHSISRQCLGSCDSEYIRIDDSIKYCDFPCRLDEYLFAGTICSDTCDSPHKVEQSTANPSLKYCQKCDFLIQESQECTDDPCDEDTYKIFEIEGVKYCELKEENEGKEKEEDSDSQLFEIRYTKDDSIRLFLFHKLLQLRKYGIALSYMFI